MAEMDVALICKALSDSNRLHIVIALLQGEMCACRLLEQFSITQPTLSHHMKVLCECGLIRMIWQFVQDQVLGMQWLNVLMGRFLTAMGLNIESQIGGSVQFFLYDVLKITVLLCLLIFMISYVQSYFPPERSKKIMGRFHGLGANCMAALLGTVTPFCSCSSIPLFIGFTSAGLPLGVTFSFLISSPMVDLGSLVLLMSIFGTKVAIAYVLLGLIVAVAGGMLIEKLHMEEQVEAFIRNASMVDIDSPSLTQLNACFMPGTR